MLNQKILKPLTDQELLGLYADLMEELRQRKIIRTSNNPVADYAEKAVVEIMKLHRCGKEEKGCDATDSNGIKYQIKGRRLTRHNSSRKLGVIRNLDLYLFNFLVVVIFDERFNILEMWKIPRKFVKGHSKWSEHVNGHIFYADVNMLNKGKDVERITC